MRHSSSSVTDRRYVERYGGVAFGSVMGILWSTPGRWGGMNPEGIPRRTSRYDSSVSRIVDLSVGEAHPGKLRVARAVVKRWSRSVLVSNVGGRTGRPSAVSGIPSVCDQGEGVSVVLSVDRPWGSVVRLCSTEGDLSCGCIQPKKKSTPRRADRAKSRALRDAMWSSSVGVRRLA